VAAPSDVRPDDELAFAVFDAVFDVAMRAIPAEEALVAGFAPPRSESEVHSEAELSLRIVPLEAAALPEPGALVTSASAQPGASPSRASHASQVFRLTEDPLYGRITQPNKCKRPYF
jgi:hypothetical protein